VPPRDDPPRGDRSREPSDPSDGSTGAAREGDRSRVGGTTRTTGRGGRGARARTARVPGRVRARQGPRRDSRRVLRRRPGADDGGERRGAAARAEQAARATGGALGLSTARRAAVLAVVVCALALTVAVPLRNYVAQRHELAAVAEQQARLRTEVDALAAERAALSDPAHVEALARERLGYVRPGETPYRVQLPGDAAASASARDAAVAATLPPSEAELPWYTRVARSTLGAAP
jgi:cell division protein FtsB